MFVYRYSEIKPVEYDNIYTRSRETKTIEYDNIYSAMARALWELDYGSGFIVDITLPTGGVLDFNTIMNWLEDRGWE